MAILETDLDLIRERIEIDISVWFVRKLTKLQQFVGLIITAEELT